MSHAPSTLDYANERPPSRARRLIARAALAASVVLAVYFAGSFVPLTWVSEAYMCRTCGHAERRISWRISRVRIWSRTEPLSLGLDSTYDRLIGQPHAHRMFRYAVTHMHGNLWRYGGIGEGGAWEPSLAVRAALEGMEGIDQSNPNLPLDARREIYTQLQRCNTEADVRQWLQDHSDQYRGEHR